MARNSIITKYDWAQDPSVDITGGAWEGQLPAVNMLTLQPQLVAQVVGTSVSFTINLGASRSVGLIHLQRLVTDSSGTIQVTAGSYDSGVVNSWATDLVGVYPPLLYAALGRTRVFIPPAPVTTSSVSFTINAYRECAIDRRRIECRSNSVWFHIRYSSGEEAKVGFWCRRLERVER
jgi:hypothetical protein